MHFNLQPEGIATKRFIVLALSIFVFCPGRSVAQEEFRATSGGFSIVIHAVLWVACEKKLFRKHCLDREYPAVESGTPATQVLLANEFQIVFTTGARATTANRR